MKKLIFTLVMFAALIAVPKQSEAQRQNVLNNGSELEFRMYDNSMFVVIFDRRIYDSPTSLFRLSNIKPGNHRIVIKKRYGRYGSDRIVYNGSVKIPPRSVVYARINRYNRFEITRVTDIAGYGSGYNNNNNNNGYYNKPMLDLPRLQTSMRHASFENDKLRIARQAISTHRVKANQIYRILMSFSFESTKLKLAKFAYRHCVDKRNYYLVNDAFSFSSSIRELDNYIGGFQSDYYDDDWDDYNRGNNDRW
ncbi:MAG: DUF4476 domain-containing protein [Bacteroidales bacterium]|nr:DUF4476 domain-containing protein [Bacteroidales bacterium]